MKLTPTMKGQITRSLKNFQPVNPNATFAAKWAVVTEVLQRYMPRQQAKHVARNYVNSLQS